MARMRPKIAQPEHYHFPYITLQLLAKIRGIFETYPHIREARIFGPHAIDTAKNETPIDIALFGESLTANEGDRIYQYLSQTLDIKHAPRIVITHLVPNGLRQHIMDEGVVIFTPSARLL